MERHPPLDRFCCGTAPLKEATQGGKRSEIATKRLCIASDCRLINLEVT